MAMEEVGTAIVGAGIAGLYAAFLLIRSGTPPRELEVFEASNRLGGRIHTLHSPDSSSLALDMGAQLVREDDSRLRSLLKQFGIATVVKPPGESRGLVHLRGRTLTNAQLRHAWLRPPFNYDVGVRLQRGDPGRVLRKALALLKAGMGDGRDGDALLGEELSRVLQTEEIAYLSGRTGYSFWNAPLNAGAVLDWSVREMFGNGRRIYEVPSGMGALVRALATAIYAQGGVISTHHTLKSLEVPASQDKPSTLVFVDGKGAARTVKARRVILALPQKALNGIERFSDLARVARLLGSIRAWPVLTAALVYPETWWLPLGFRETSTYTDLPLGVIRHLGAEAWRGSGSNQGAVNLYVDGAKGAYWRSVFGPMDAGRWLAPDHPVTVEMHRNLNALYEPLLGSPLPAPLRAAVCDWAETPFGGAFHLWAAGSDPEICVKRAAQPVPGRNVHICGEAWSQKQAWVEGALESVETMLARHFTLPALDLDREKRLDTAS